MIKKYFFLFLGIIISFFIFTSQQVNAQMGVACYSGSWVQPTCNPNTSDPNNCNILPPLFSGAACDQHTGYLRIQDELSPASQGSWTQLFPGKILLGQVGGGFDPINGSIEVSGSIIAGEFSASTPPTYRGAGDIAALSDIYARNRLQIDGVTTLYGNLNVNNIATFNTNLATGNNFLITNGVAGNATTFRIRQTTGDIGRIMDLIPGENSPEVNNIYFDHLGFLNATKDFQIRIDANDNGNNQFRINNGNSPNGVPVFIVNESGDTTISGNLSVSGNASINRALSADSFIANSGQGTIQGKFVQSSNGNPCADNQLLVYRISAGVGNWFCTASNSVGTTTVGNLLQTLQAGADASSFEGHVQIGTDFNGLTLTGPENFISGPALLNIKNREAVSLNNQLMGVINFTDGYNQQGQAKIEVARGASGSGGDYPTKMSFWTTPDGSSIAQERLTILHNGNVGITNTSPTARLNINVPVNTEGIRLINNNYSPLVIRNNADAIDIFRVNQSGNVTALGNLGLGGISNPGYSIHVNKTVGQASLALETTAVGNGASIELRNSDATQIPFIDLTKGWTSGNTPDYSGRIAYWSDNDFRIIQATNNPLSFWTNDTKRMTINGSGRVGIGTDSPSALLHLVNTSASTDIRLEGNGSSSRYPNLSFYNGSTKVAQIISDVAQGSYLLDYSSSYGGTFRIRSTPDNNAATVLLINTAGNVGINNTSPSTKLDVTGTVRGTFVGSSGALCANGQVLVFDGTNWNCGTVTGSDNLGNHTATQNLNMSGYQIVNAATGTFTVVSANKITVNTIDPVYTIQGEKYATYVPAMTGVKEETTGLLQLKLDKASGLVSGEIDFTLLAKGSDLWIFAQTINYQKNFEQIVILMTPAFDGRVWYEKDITKKTLKIFGKPLNNLAKEYEVSYRLTGPRFDYQQWPNITDEETEGLNIDKFLQNN